jgi:sulfur-oxidizing protein SoxX
MAPLAAIRTSLLCLLALPFATSAASAPESLVKPDKGYCMACHQLPEGVAPASLATLGPMLSGPRMRELGRAKLKEMLQDPTTANPDSLMPPYGRHRILEKAEIDRIVEFLLALP